MNKLNQFSIVSLLSTIFLLPVFFIPSLLFTSEVSKISFLVVGVIISLLLFLLASLRQRSISLPKTYILFGAFVIPAAYLLSSLGSAVPRLSLFGYAFEVGTFGFISLAFALFALSSLVFKDAVLVTRAISALYVSLSILVLFALTKLLSGGGFPVWKIFSGKLANPIGSWSDYAIGFGLLSVLSSLALGILRLKKSMSIFVSVVFVISTVLLVIANFSTAFVFTLIISAIVMIYLLTVEENVISDESDHSKGRRVVLWPAIVMCAVSLVFALNPMVSENVSLSNKVSTAFGLSNTYVRPSLDSTLDVTKGVIATSPIFGSGPATFDKVWLQYKPKEINSTIFWNTSFPSGVGFLPTQVASVGIIGTLAWVLFLAGFVVLGFRAMSHIPSDSWQRFNVVSTFFAALFLWSVFLAYMPGVVILALAFVFTGLFVAAIRSSGIIATRELLFSQSAVLNFGSSLVITSLAIGAVFIGYQALSRTVSLFQFQKAVAMSNTEGASVAEVEARILKAISLVPQDVYYISLSKLNLAQAQSILNGGREVQETNKELLATAIQKSVSAAQSAKDLNPASYSNWISLATLYSSLAPQPFSMPGALESAKNALEEARKRNPNSPEVPLILATLEFDQNNNSAARTLVEESIALKQDYADAYFLLAQIEIRENNIMKAIRSVEASALLAGNNAGLFFQLGLLRYENRDYIEAARAFNSALQIEPQYGNARYYLGLSLDKLGRREEAIITFEDLSRSNPDNELIIKILENLKSNKEALFGIGNQNEAPDNKITPPVNQ